MRIHLRLDEVTSSHIRETVFFNGANCGQLTLTHGEYQVFGAALLLGAQKMQGRLIVETDKIDFDEKGNFKISKKPGKG